MFASMITAPPRACGNALPARPKCLLPALARWLSCFLLSPSVVFGGSCSVGHTHVHTCMSVCTCVSVCGCLTESSAGRSSGLILVFHLLTQIEQMLGLAEQGIDRHLPATLEEDSLYTF